MIEEAVNSILEAEDLSAKKIAEAKQSAYGIVDFAEKEADEFKKKTSAKNKVVFAQKSKDVDEEAKKASEELLAKTNAETDKEMSAYEKNKKDAVKIILGQLL